MEASTSPSIERKMSPEISIESSSDSWPDSDQESDTNDDKGIAHALLFPPEHGKSWARVLESGEDWKLCTDCQTLLSSAASLDNEDWEDRMFKTSISKIQTSRDRGCKFCDAICQALSWAQLWNETDQTLFLEALNPTTIAIDKTRWTKNSEKIVLISIGTKNLEPEIFPSHQKQSRRISPPTLSFITKQLTNCLSNPYHHSCNPLWNSSTPWPARMLHITGDTITLVPFDTEAMPGNFAALSYCWGDSATLRANPPLTATASTVRSLQTAIPVSFLPLTLLESVRVCSALSIPYIWIDSLCILQDSSSDWSVEAAKMETVYAKAKVTIIAAASTSCHSGFLDRSQSVRQTVLSTPNVIAPCCSPSSSCGSTKNDQDNNDDDLFLELRARTSSVKGYHSPSLPTDPIDYRGWTYQEEHLSTRYIKFTSDGDVQWKCFGGTTCACGQRPAEEYTWQFFLSQGGGEEEETPSTSNLGSEPEPLVGQTKTGGGGLGLGLGPLERWERMAQKFSARKFTVWSDKLVAVSSLARRFAAEGINKQEEDIKEGIIKEGEGGRRVKGLGQYVGGLWESKLVSQLNWVYPNEGMGRCCFSDQVGKDEDEDDYYIAPSWSWASINGSGVPLIWEPKFDWDLAEVLKVGKELAWKGNEFGRILGGFVELRGPVFGCSLEVGEERDGAALRVKMEEMPFTAKVRSAQLDCMGLGPARCSHAFSKNSACVLLLGGITRMINDCWVYGLIMRELDDGRGYQRLGLLSLVTERDAAPTVESLGKWSKHVVIF